MPINHRSLNLLTKKMCIFSNFLDFLSSAGYLALWRGGQAAPQRTCVTCLQRWTLSNLPWPLLTSSTKLCWDLNYTDEGAGLICSGRNFHAIFDIIIFICCALIALYHCAWLFGCFFFYSALIYPSTENSKKQIDKPKTGLTGNSAK